MSSRSTQIIGGPDREHAHVDTTTNALLVKVVNPGGGTGSNVNIAEVGGTAIGSTVPISDGGGSITVDGSLTATFGGLVSAGNATTTPLGSNATYTGTWEDVTNYATLTVTVYANVPSATDGMKFEWSGNGVNIDEAESITISAAHPGRAMSLNVRGRYFRIVYTNGGTAQTTFRLGTVYRPSGIGANNHPITDDLEDTTLAIMTRSIIVGETTGGGGGGYENVKVTPSGALTVEINDGGGSITVDGTVAVSSVSGTVTVGDGGGSLTVDGTVAATQSGAWTVSVNEPVSVDDNGGSLTVDGTVAVSSVGGTVVVGDGGGSLTVDGTVAVSSIGSTVVVGDGGGSLTVDGTVAVSSVGGTVTVTGTVSVNEPVSVDDNGGSLTVDGTVTAAQATHDNLNANVTIQVGDVDVSTGNPVPVSDAGGSLTVDGTVAVSSISGTVTVSGTVSVNEPVSVDDNGGSLTVDGTVAATQSGSWTVTAAQATHNNLNANANIQVGDVDVGNGNPVPVSDAGGSLTVDGTVAVSSVGGTVTVGDGGGSITVDGTVAVSSISGSVTIAEPVSVDDNGGSLTVDGTVAVSSVSGSVTVAQATHNNLNANANIQVGDVDVGNANPVPVSDAGGSLTVDGTVAATQSGAWTVSVNEPVSVDDNGGSLTVDGTVAATQSGSWTVTAAQVAHDNLNANANIQVANVDVGNANPVPVSDAGGSLTVDGTVAVSSVGGTVTVTGTVSVNEPVSVDDNGGSLTVDGTVAATQSGSWTVTAAQATHDNLNANANIQVGDVDVGNANPVPVSDAGGSLTVDGTVAVSSVSGSVTVAQATHNNLNLNANIQVADVDVGNANPVPVSDAGGSLTVDGTVAATQSGAWTVSVNEPVSVDDNGGSLTVDGTVAVSSVGGTVTVGDGGGSLTVDGTVTAAQTTHDNLNLNANLQVNNTDVSNSNRVPISDGNGSITVDGNVAILSNTGYEIEAYQQVQNVPTVSSGPTTQFEISSSPGAVISGLGLTNGQWCHPFMDPATGGIYVNVVNPGGASSNVNISQVGGVTIGTTVPVSDGGSSLTVDGTVAATQSGSWTVTAAQTTHDNLNLNANLQVNNTDVSNSNRVPISDGGSSITIDGTVTANVYSNGTGLELEVYAQYQPLPTNSIGIAPQFELNNNPTQVLTNAGATNGLWCHGFIDTTTGGLVIHPGTGATNLGKAEDTAHTSGSTGVMVLAVRNDSMTVFAGPTGDYIPFSTDAAGRLQIIKSGGKATYRAATTNNVVVVAGTVSFFILSGSSTKTVTVQRVTITCPTLTAVAYHSLVLRKFSSAPTGGTATALTKIPLDSASAASTANLCQVYTAAPTDGAPVGTIGCQRFLSQATTAAAAGTPTAPIVWDFRNGFGEGSGVVLRGTAETIGVSFNPAPASAVTLSVEVEWIEE